jgi:hypothetical protein
MSFRKNPVVRMAFANRSKSRTFRYLSTTWLRPSVPVPNPICSIPIRFRIAVNSAAQS